MLYVTGRAKDIIIRGGENIAAAHVEEVLHRHPAVAAVAVVGLPDPDLGEIVGAIVQVRAPVAEGELSAFAAEHLARFEIPARWLLQPEPLQMTEAGKIAKHELRADWLARDASAGVDYRHAGELVEGRAGVCRDPEQPARQPAWCRP